MFDEFLCSTRVLLCFPPYSQTLPTYSFCSPGGTSGKESACRSSTHKRHGLDPWIKKIPWSRKTATQPSILAWKIPWTEEPGGIQSVKHNWAHMHKYLLAGSKTIQWGLKKIFIYLAASGLICITWDLLLQYVGSVVVPHWFSCPAACRSLVSQSGMEPTPMHCEVDS